MAAPSIDFKKARNTPDTTPVLPSRIKALQDTLSNIVKLVAQPLNDDHPQENQEIEKATESVRHAQEILDAALSSFQISSNSLKSTANTLSIRNRDADSSPGTIHTREDECRMGTPLHLDEILFVTKQSKVQWDMEHTGLSYGDLLKSYDAVGDDKEKVVGSHLRQVQLVEDIGKLVPSAQIVPNRALTLDLVRKYKLIVALGGDDHFKFVSHAIDDDTPILGVNSDAQTSEGNILGCTGAELPAILSQIKKGEYLLAPWTRLRLKVNGKDIGPALGDIVLAKRDFRLMSRHQVEFGTSRAMHKSSGLLVSTGTGSTGWFTSAGLYLYPQGRPFPRTAPYARFELREPFPKLTQDQAGRVQISYPPLTEGVLAKGEKLIVKSFNNTDGIVSRDSLDTVPFERGKVAEITIDSKPLWVLIPQRKTPLPKLT